MQETTASNAPSTNATPSASSSAETPDDRATSFQAVKGGGETVPGGTLLVSAYAVIWVIVLLVVVRVFRKQSKTAEQIASLERAIENAAKKGAA